MQRLALALTFLLASTPLAAQEPAQPAPAVRAADTVLEGMRAGAAPAAAAPLRAEARAALDAAAAPELEALRATDLGLSDREVRLILITAGAALLLAILL
jgi:hypothetical protein